MRKYLGWAFLIVIGLALCGLWYWMSWADKVPVLTNAEATQVVATLWHQPASLPSEINVSPRPGEPVSSLEWISIRVPYDWLEQLIESRSSVFQARIDGYPINPFMASLSATESVSIYIDMPGLLPGLHLVSIYLQRPSGEEVFYSWVFLLVDE